MQPQSPYTRTVIDESPAGIKVTMTSPRIGCVAAFLAVWMLGWAAGEISALRGLFSMLGQGAFSLVAGAFLMFWLAGWTVGGIFAGSMLLFMIDGREIVTIGDGILRRRAEAFKWGLSWRYELARCSNLRPTGDGETKSFISFDYAGAKGEKTVRFGTGLTEDRASEIVEKAWALVPSLMPDRERRKREREAAAATSG